MLDRAFFRSLYWRIAAGFVAMLAVLLILQTSIFLWLTGRFTESSSSRTPQELADLVARDLSEALSENAALDLDQFVARRFSEVRQPFVVVMRDGRRASNHPGTLPPGFGERLGRRGGPPFLDRPGFGMGPGGRGDGPRDQPSAEPTPNGQRGTSPPFPDRPPPGAEDRGRRRGLGRGGPGPPLLLSPIVVNAAQVGHVAVPSGPPPTEVLLRELGPTLTWTGLGLLTVGSMLTALVIFRPARRRLRSLEEAARALGQGRTDVRADERGGDEVSTLAQAFNRMAGELETRSTALAASDKARRQLLADVSHELMTPLTAIRGYTQTLAMPDLNMEPAARARYFAIVDEETYTLEAIIGDLLELAKLEGGGSSLTLEDVPVAELFRRIVDRHAPTVQQRGISMTVDASDDVMVRGDVQRLEQALQNIAANAVRHSPPGGEVRLRAQARGNEAVITVRDTGTGIPPEHLPHIFDRFYKADASRTAGATATGSGLGLSIVRAIVERHGGSIRASNDAEGGAVFEIVLPAGETGGNGGTEK